MLRFIWRNFPYFFMICVVLILIPWGKDYYFTDVKMQLRITYMSWERREACEVNGVHQLVTVKGNSWDNTIIPYWPHDLKDVGYINCTERTQREYYRIELDQSGLPGASGARPLGDDCEVSFSFWDRHKVDDIVISTNSQSGPINCKSLYN